MIDAQQPNLSVNGQNEQGEETKAWNAQQRLDHDPEAEAVRFESNRRYDHRPAIENIDRPTLVLTTRNQLADETGPNLIGAAIVAGLMLVALGAGAFIGSQSARPDDAPTTVTIPSAASLPAGVELIEPAPSASDDASVEVAEVIEPESSDAANFLAELDALDLKRLGFVPGEINLTPGGIEVSERLVTVLITHPNQPVELRVRTYSESTPGKNHGLSVHQANALRSMLTSAGVEANRMTVVGLGSLDVDRPTAAAALFLDSTNVSVSQELASQGPLVFENPFAGMLDPDSAEVLRSASSAIGDSPLLLVGYSWSATTDDANHHLSHELLDSATSLFVESGIPADRIASVGLGSAALSLTERTTVVTVEVGAAAGIAVSLGAIPMDAVSFEPDTTLTQPGSDTLDAVADLMTANPDVHVEVAVHFYGATTSQGNHDASQLQADAIGAYMGSVGVTTDRLRLMAHGDPPHFAVPGRHSVVTFTVIR